MASMQTHPCRAVIGYSLSCKYRTFPQMKVAEIMNFFSIFNGEFTFSTTVVCLILHIEI